jgi:hypothetical protein
MRAARKNWKTYALGVAAVAALLSSTACESGGTDDAARPTPSGTASATGSAGPGDGSGISSSGSANSGGSGDSGSSGGSGGAATAACADPDLSITTSLWRHDEGRHLLITATNISDKPCTLYHYPYVSFGADIENPLSPMESKPQVIATIKPKGKAYAGLLLFRPDEKTNTFKSFALGYQDRVPNSGGDAAPLDIAFSDDIDSVAVGPNPLITYWNVDLGAVQNFMIKAGRS